MNTKLKNQIIDNFEKTKNYFYANCELIIFDLSKNYLIKILNNKQFELKLIKIFNRLIDGKYYYFKAKIKADSSSLILMGKDLDFVIKNLYSHYQSYLEKSEGKYFIYLIIENKKKSLQNKELFSQIKNLFKEFNIRNKVFSSIYCKYCDEINFHALAQNIYDSYRINDKDYKTIVKDIKNEFKEESNLSKLPSKIKIYEFQKYVDNQIYNDVSLNTIKEVTKQLIQITEEYKQLREEFYLINSYITKYGIDKNCEICIGGKKEIWDAKILLPNEEIILEVTQATSSIDYLLRGALSSLRTSSYKELSLKYRSLHQEELNEFPEMIIKAIEKKHQKRYDDNRVLLVMVLFEMAYLEEKIVAYWITELKEKTQKGSFKEIILVINENNFFKIH